VRETDPEDRRRTYISLNPQGKLKFAEVEPVVQEIREESWQALNDEDYDNFVRILNQVFNNLES
ncbi:MAG: MarR family transcriptional regulator, partial [Bacteroidota bacterium]